MPRTTSNSKLTLWRNRFEQFSSSHLTVQQFCESVGCTTPTFYYWKRKVESDAGLSSSKPKTRASAFVPVVVRGASAKPILVRVKDGTRIAVPADAIAALEVILQHAYRVA